VALLGSDGKSIGNVDSSDSLKLMRLSPRQGRDIAENPDAIRTVRTLDGDELRVGAHSLQTPNGTLVVVSGLSTDEVRKTLGRLDAVELIIGASALLLALLATLYGVRFSLRRLRRVTDTAQEVAAELSPTGTGLERRVDVPDDGSEVGQLAESMNTLLAAVETQFKARLASEARLRQFLADASHELRTPLTSIRGYAELARMQRAAGANAEDNLARIESEGTRMSRLVEDLLMLARGDQGGTPPARELVDVGALVDDAATSTRAAFPDRHIDAESVPDLYVLGDHDQLLRVVRNLLTNAAVHTAAGRPIVVRCAPADGATVIQVVDGGPGLPPDEAAHVFERFWRADKARSRARGGTGLGLPIVASIVAAHGGTVRFDSSVEHGSTVTVTLPAPA
jgi:two-component system OmpR family sensor kinase